MGSSILGTYDDAAVLRRDVEALERLQSIVEGFDYSTNDESFSR